MRHFHFAKYSMTAMSVPVSLLALTAIGCSGSYPQADEVAAQAIGGAQHETGSLPNTGAAPSPITAPADDAGAGDAGSPVTAPADYVGTADAGLPVAALAAGSKVDAAPVPAPASSPNPVPSGSSAGLSLRVVGNPVSYTHLRGRPKLRARRRVSRHWTR